MECTYDKFIKSLNFQSCVLDPCLYYRYHHSQLALRCVYVDDRIICPCDKQYIIEIKSRYDMTDMGRLMSFLNIRVTWEETGVLFSFS